MESTIKIQALANNVVVIPITLENKTKGGFDLTGIVDVNEKQQAGVVHSFGEFCGKKADGTPVLKIGMTILFNKFNTTPTTIDGKLYLIVPYLNCLTSL